LSFPPKLSRMARAEWPGQGGRGAGAARVTGAANSTPARAPLCRSFEAYNRAAAQGRTHADYAAAVPFGQAYAARPWLGHVVSALGLAPHTLGLFLTNMYLVAPPAAPAAS
jgi:hypothetical protein